MPLIEEQLERLKAEYPEASITPLPGGSNLVTIPNVKLPSGWSHPTTIVRFLILANYPHSRPDCFWVDPQLRLESGVLPKASNLQVIPGTSYNWLWFSWHPMNWSPNNDSLFTYMKVIEQRLKEVQ